MKQISVALAFGAPIAATILLLNGRNGAFPEQGPETGMRAASPKADNGAALSQSSRRDRRAGGTTSDSKLPDLERAPDALELASATSSHIAHAMLVYRETGTLQMLRDSLLAAVRNDPTAAFATLTSLPLSDRLKIDIGGEMLAVWTENAPREAAAWAEKSRWLDAFGGPVATVADQWARQEPDAALDWAASLAPGMDQIAALVAATGRWSKTDFPAVAGHVSRQPSGTPRDVMAGTLAREFGQEDPMSGLKWALVIDDPVGRERAAAGAIADLHAANPAHAALLLESAGLAEDFRQAVEKRVAGPLPWWH